MLGVFEKKIKNFFFIKIQQLWKNIEGIKKFILLNNTLLTKNSFLKRNKKKYNKFFNSLTSFNFAQLTKTINNQFALELSRTKKHWRIIRLFESFIINYLTQLEKTCQLQSQISGSQLFITGRPNKSSRTQHIKIFFGSCKRTTLDKINTNKTVSTANAKIGTFGITILTTL